MAGKEKRTAVLTLTEAESSKIWIALDRLEGEYRGSRCNIIAGQPGRYTRNLADAENGIRETYNLKRRVMAARHRKPGSKSHE